MNVIAILPSAIEEKMNVIAILGGGVLVSGIINACIVSRFQLSFWWLNKICMV